MFDYPLRFSPIFKERLWGGRKLERVLEKPVSGETIGESWELSGVQGDISVVENGPLQGKNLNELIALNPENLLGKSVVERFGTEFPILIKFIDAQKDLSIQLHPHDDLARERHNSFGKTEMWYIMDAEDSAELIVGFNREMDKETYQQALEDGDLESLMNYERVNRGDCFFINTGKVHAIGAGILLAEIQQTSDVTYRIYDFNRRDKDGNLRELHTDLALDAIDYEKKDDYLVDYSRRNNTINEVVESPYFKTNYLRLDAPFDMDLNSRDSFTILMCVGGKATIEAPAGSEEIKRGETLLIPAQVGKLNISTEGVELLEVSI